jgi:hypothetical protein
MNEILANLMSQFGMNESQAKGGLGMVLNLLKENLNDADYSEVANLFSDPSNLINLAQKFMQNSDETSNGLSGLLSSMSSMTSALGIDTGSLGNLTKLMSGLDSIGIDASKFGSFVEMITGFLKSNLGDEIVGKVLNSLRPN